MAYLRRLSPFLLALAAACTDARYDEPEASPDAASPAREAAVTPDGGVRTPSAEAGPSVVAEAGTPDAASAPLDAGPTLAWYDTLPRNYAISIRFFSKDRGLADQALYSHEIILLAKVAIANGKVMLDAQRCRDHGSVIAVALGLKDEFEWVYPQRTPRQQLELVMRPDGLRTEAPPRRIGFTEQPAACTPGQQLTFPDRKWLPGGKCECRNDPLPMVATDCRIIDDDGDGEAGFTLQHKGLLNEFEQARLLDSTQIVEGKLGEGGHIKASFLENYESLSLICGDNPCTRAEIGACPLQLNPVLFEPLADKTEEWTCDAVLKDVVDGKLFPLPMLTFVNGC